MQEPRLFGLREQPCEERNNAVNTSHQLPASLDPNPSLPIIPCTISRFSSPREMPTGMLGLVGSVTVSPLAGM